MRIVVAFLVSAPFGIAASAQEAMDAEGVERFVGQWCVECHGGDTTKGGLDLTRPAANDVERLWRWTRLRDRVRSAEMPPVGAEAPAASERARFAEWVSATLRTDVPKLPLDPGRATVRRLSRTQWEGVVRDLFAVEVDTSAFPADDLGYGFDTIGDALTFSTLHLEKYGAAARDVAVAVFHGEDPKRPAVRRFEAESMQLVEGAGAGMDGDVANLYQRAGIEQVVRLPRDGVYRLVLSAGADQAGDEPAQMVLRLDGRDLDTFEVPERRPREFVLTAPLCGGERRLGVAFVNDYYDPKHEDPQRRDRNLKVDWLEVRGPLDARVVPPAQRWVQDALAGRGSEGQRLRSLVRALLPRVYRRSVTDDEVTRVVRVGEGALKAGESLLVAARLVLQTVLSSPHFLFRIEPVASGTGATAPVPGPALATRLAFFLWASGPDDRLAELGRSGRLGERSVLEGEVQRLLADPRADALATDFAAQWLELRNLADRTPDPARFPGFDDTLRSSMRRETELLFAAVLREERDVRELLDCEFTHVDPVLAAFYGLPAPSSEGFQRVVLPPELRERGGVLGHASVHAVTSNPTRTSPVKRGKWILENLLGQPPPPPPPGNDTLPDEAAIDSTRSFRERLAQHRSRASCAGCHVRMDTLGFALERYDAIGRHRERDAGGEIDCRGELPDGRRVDGLRGLVEVIVADPSFVHTLAKKLFVYANGRDLRPADRLRLALRVDELLARGKVTLRDLVLLIVRDDAFVFRASSNDR